MFLAKHCFSWCATGVLCLAYFLDIDKNVIR